MILKKTYTHIHTDRRLPSIVMRLAEYYNDLIRPQYRREHAPKNLEEGLTHAGRLVILRNIWTGINTEFFQLKFEILKDDPSPMIYNALLFRVTTSLKSLLDSIARLCNDVYPLPSLPRSSSEIYFHTYGFFHSEFKTLRVHYINISKLKYNGRSFNSFANTLKHEVPWIGLCTMNSEEIVDIFDGSDIGLMDNVLYTVLKNSSSILEKLEHVISFKNSGSHNLP